MKNNSYVRNIQMEYKVEQGGGILDTGSRISSSITPDSIIRIREVLATGIAKSLANKVIQSLHIEDNEEKTALQN